MRNVKVSNKPANQYAATTPVQVEFTNNSNIERKNNPVFKRAPTDYYTKLNDISDKTTISPSARKQITTYNPLLDFQHIEILGFLVAVENVQYLSRGCNKGQEIRAIQVRDDSTEESRQMILRGPAVRIIHVND